MFCQYTSLEAMTPETPALTTGRRRSSMQMPIDLNQIDPSLYQVQLFAKITKG